MSSSPRNEISPEQNMFFLANQRTILLSLSNSLMTSSRFLIELTWIDKVIPFKIKSEKPSQPELW